MKKLLLLFVLSAILLNVYTQDFKSYNCIEFNNRCFLPKITHDSEGVFKIETSAITICLCNLKVGTNNIYNNNAIIPLTGITKPHCTVAFKHFAQKVTFVSGSINYSTNTLSGYLLLSDNLKNQITKDTIKIELQL